MLNLKQRQYQNNGQFDDSIHPLIQRLYLSRGVAAMPDLDYSLKNLYPYSKLKNIQAAVELVYSAIENHKRILVVADFDADGATSCAVAIRGLSALGARHIEFIVPNRFEFGYGLTPEIVELARDLEPDLIITVDNGISSIEGVRTARDMGIDVLVTDHHLPGAKLPEANVILNPNLPDDEYPGKSLAGVGVMFQLLIALRSYLREKDFFNQQALAEPNLAHLLDLVALGTVADLVPLDRNNRILVAQGLARIRSGRCCEGIKALVSISRRSITTLKASDLAFMIAPRLNAAGRLTDMSHGIECLLTDDFMTAMQFARELDELNTERKRIQENMQEQALKSLDVADMDNQLDNDFGLCLYNENWHQGVVGILASKLKEQFNRPVIAFAPDQQGVIKGSARSIEGIHIRDVLESIHSQNPGLIDKFGGHAMAAGLSLKLDKLTPFRQQFCATLEQLIEPEHINGEILTDGELKADELTLAMAKQIQQAGPWGQAFPEPVFEGTFRILEKKVVGQNHLKMRLQSPGANNDIEAILFNETDEYWPDDLAEVQMTYQLDINHYQNRESVQLLVRNLHHS